MKWVIIYLLVGCLFALKLFDDIQKIVSFDKAKKVPLPIYIVDIIFWPINIITLLYALLTFKDNPWNSPTEAARRVEKMINDFNKTNKKVKNGKKNRRY